MSQHDVLRNIETKAGTGDIYLGRVLAAPTFGEKSWSVFIRNANPGVFRIEKYFAVLFGKSYRDGTFWCVLDGVVYEVAHDMLHDLILIALPWYSRLRCRFLA